MLKIEKCSESIGITFVLYLEARLFIKCQPHIIDSLLASRIFLLLLVIIKVGSRPAIPGIADIVISDFFVNCFVSNLFRILVL